MHLLLLTHELHICYSYQCKNPFLLPGRSALPEQELGCVLCDRGQFAAEDSASQCNNCPPAMYAEGRGASSCMRCPANTFRVDSGATSPSDCYGCSAKVANNMVTLAQFGSHTPDDCVCDSSYLDVGKFDESGQIRSLATRCIDCPFGADCRKPGK